MDEKSLIDMIRSLFVDNYMERLSSCLNDERATGYVRGQHDAANKIIELIVGKER